MPRKTKALVDWQGDCWSGDDWKHLVRQFAKATTAIIDITNLSEVAEIDALIGDILQALAEAMAYARCPDRYGSSAQVYRTLQQLLKDPGHLTDQLWRIDPTTRDVIAVCYPSPADFHTDDVEPKALERACQLAFECLPEPPRGRPKGSDQLARKVLAVRLGEAYRRHVKSPTRRYDFASRQFYGPFKDFVEVIMAAAPAPLRTYKGGGKKSVDHMVQVAIDALRTTRAPGHRSDVVEDLEAWFTKFRECCASRLQDKQTD